MSSSSFESTVDLTLLSSPLAHQLLFWLHVLPLLMIGFGGGSGSGQLVVAFAIGLSWLWTRRHPAFGHGPRAITRITWHADGRWNIQVGSQVVEAELQGNSYVHRVLMVLNFRVGTRRFTRILLGDETSEDPLRRLRARLATRRTATGASST